MDKIVPLAATNKQIQNEIFSGPAAGGIFFASDPNCAFYNHDTVTSFL
jgi:hypothetical protein